MYINIAEIIECSNTTEHIFVYGGGLVIRIGVYNNEGMLTQSTPLPEDFLTAPKELPYAQHVFGTRDNTYDNIDKTVRMFTERLGPIAHMRQVHGNRIKYVETSGVYEECDAIFTDQKDLWLAVKTADCVPILVSSPVAVAVIHAGWRGLENGIIGAMIDALQTEFGLDSHEIHALVGPCISQQNYEVDGHFKEIFAEYPRHIKAGDTDDKVKLDLRGIAEQQLIEGGLMDLNIAVTPECTFENDEQLFSFRKGTGKEAHQRQLSLIKRV